MPSSKAAGKTRGVLLALLLLLLQTGCSVKLAYNNADRLIRWGASDFVDLSNEQRTYFDSEIADFLYWHRQTQLPLYSAGLNDLNRAVQQGVDAVYLASFTTQVEQWAEHMEDRLLPIATQVLLSLDDEQVQQLPARFANANSEWLEDEWGKSRAEAQQEWMNGFADGFRRFTGRLNPSQLAYLSDAVTQYEPEAPTWLAYRERWQDALLDLLANRANAEQFQRDFEKLSRSREDYYGDYAAVDQANQALATKIVGWLLTNLTEKQQRKFSKRMLTLVEDFDELAADLRDKPTPATACLVTTLACP